MAAKDAEYQKFWMTVMGLSVFTCFSTRVVLCGSTNGSQEEHQRPNHLAQLLRGRPDYMVVAVDWSASCSWRHRRRRAHGHLGALRVVELVDLEPELADGREDPAALLPVAAPGDGADEYAEAHVAVVGARVPRALRQAVERHEAGVRHRAGGEHARRPVGGLRLEVGHERAEPRHELLRLVHAVGVRELEDGVRRVGRAEEAGVGVAQQAAFVDAQGALLAWARAGDLARRGVEARAAVRRADVAAALRERVRLAGDGLGEPGGGGRGGREGGERRVEVGLERAAARVVHADRALGVDGEHEDVGVGRSGESEILGFMSASSNTLSGLRSRWMIVNLESSWRYRSPRPIPSMILYLCSQLNFCCVVGSEKFTLPH
ncbi:hypothetical protein U9M48_044398 [Paspalum notatum var. saurae]|uniref:Uncharacterized protein n=1 Tax=Paspalum notatum var. saurae TaxID=547442 RepID=A0AAQ3XHG7_PASNO